MRDLVWLPFFWLLSTATVLHFLICRSAPCCGARARRPSLYDFLSKLEPGHFVSALPQPLPAPVEHFSAADSLRALNDALRRRSSGAPTAHCCGLGARCRRPCVVFTPCNGADRRSRARCANQCVCIFFSVHKTLPPLTASASTTTTQHQKMEK